ncbi:nitroreductase/quinone reductase family protein [Actinocorallia aurea]
MTNATVPRYVNTLVRALLRSPAHRLLSRNTMLLTYTGRKTGTPYTVAVSYVRDGDTLICYTDSAWWKNLRGGAPVTVVLAGRTFHGTAEPVALEPADAVASLEAFLHRTPRDAKYHGLRRNPDGTYDPAALADAARTSTLIRIGLTASPFA